MSGIFVLWLLWFNDFTAEWHPPPDTWHAHCHMHGSDWGCEWGSPYSVWERGIQSWALLDGIVSLWKSNIAICASRVFSSEHTSILAAAWHAFHHATLYVACATSISSMLPCMCNTLFNAILALCKYVNVHVCVCMRLCVVCVCARLCACTCIDTTHRCTRPFNHCLPLHYHLFPPVHCSIHSKAEVPNTCELRTEHSPPSSCAGPTYVREGVMQHVL